MDASVHPAPSSTTQVETAEISVWGSCGISSGVDGVAGKEKKLGVIDVPTDASYKVIRGLIIMHLDDIPELFRMLETEDGKEIEFSQEKQLKYQFGEKNAVHIVTPTKVIDNETNIGVKPIEKNKYDKNNRRRSSFFHHNIDVLNEEHVLPAKFVMIIVMDSFAMFLFGIAIQGSLIPLLAKAGLHAHVTSDGRILDLYDDYRVSVGQFFNATFFIEIFLYAIPLVLPASLLHMEVNKGGSFLYTMIQILPSKIIFAGFSILVVHNMLSLLLNWMPPLSAVITSQLLNISSFIFFTVIGRKFKTNVGIQLLKTLLILMLSVQFLAHSNIIQIIREVDEVYKVALNTVVVPIFREAFTTILRGISRNLHVKNKKSDISIICLYALPMSLTTRFLFVSLNTYMGVTTNLVLSGLNEIFLRQSQGTRDLMEYKLKRFFARKLFGRVQPVDKQVLLFDREEYRSHRARCIFLQMSIEYIAIFATPFTIYAYDSMRLLFDFSHDGDEPLDTNILLYGFVLSLVVEFSVDVLNLKVEEELFNYPVFEEFKTKYEGYHLSMMLYSVFSFIVFRHSFYKGIEPCEFSTEYFCLCIDQLTFKNQIIFCEAWLQQTANGTLYGFNMTA